MAMLQKVNEAMGELQSEVIFVGGAVTQLYAEEFMVILK